MQKKDIENFITDKNKTKNQDFLKSFNLKHNNYVDFILKRIGLTPKNQKILKKIIFKFSKRKKKLI